MEVRQQRVDAPEPEPGQDEERGSAVELTVARDRLEHAHGGGTDGEDALGRLDPRPGVWSDPVPLTVQLVIFELVDGKRPERVEPDVERDPLHVELREEIRREVETGRGGGGRTGVGGVDGLVAG